MTPLRCTGWTLLLLLLLMTSAAYSAGLGRTSGSAEAGSQDEVDDFVPYEGERFSIFDWNLLRSLAKNQKGNLLISPISLKLALVLLYEGAQDETAYELANVMHLPVGRAATRDRFTSILKSLQVPNPEYSLDLGTRIFIDKSIVPRQRYGAIAKSFYKTDVITTNFTDARSSADSINGFVNNITSGRIQKIVNDEDALKDSMMMIVNAMFFRGNWFRQPFPIDQTRIDKFTLLDGKTVDVPYMRSSHKFYYVYAPDLNAKILRLRYSGHKFSMFIILPDMPDQLDELMKKVTPFAINRHVWLMQEIPVDVMIPKFKFESTSHLEHTLRELGIRDIFDDTAILTGILRSKSTSRRLVVTDILQKAGIEVNERGTVAYTATEIEIGNKINDETFHATQPFMFYIEDETSGTILYMGIVNNPLEDCGVEDPVVPNILAGQNETAAAATIPGPALGISTDERQNFFNIELLQKLNEAHPGNVIVGTSSIKQALMVLAEAAAGHTRQQIVSALRLPGDLSSIRRVATHSIAPFMDAKTGTQLQSAIKLWLAKEAPILKNYTNILQLYYKSEFQSINLSDVVSSSKIVNDWVSKCTNGHISSIVDPASLAPDTKMLLTTAVYFKGTWLKSFDKAATRQRCFNDFRQANCQLKVPLMENVGDYKYAYVPALDAQVVDIPYTGERISMIVLLPQKQGEQALKDLSRDLAFTPLSSILASLRETEILLQIPKFKLSNKIDMRAALEQMGIRDLFDKNHANLSAAFPRGDVQVGAVLHNAQIDVNEEGTIASAATGVSVIPLIGSTATTFRADRPFIFFLLDHWTNSILFVGRYVQPDVPLAHNGAEIF